MANRYWVGGAGTWNTTSTTNWSASSGGASGASVPTAADSVFFDQAGTYTVTCTGALTCLDITVSAGTVTFATGTGPTFAISGSMSLVAGTVWSSTGAITFNATTTGKTITTNGVSISASITLNGSGGGWTLGGALTGTSFNITTGSFDTAGYSMTLSSNINLGNTGIRSVTLNNSTINCTTINASSSTNLTFNAGTSNITCGGGTGGGRTIGGPNLTFYNVTCTYGPQDFLTGNSLTISGPVTFNNLICTGVPTTFGALMLTGNVTVNGLLTLPPSSNAYANRLQVYSGNNTTVSRGTQVTLTVASISAVSDTDFCDIIFAGAAAPLSGTRLGNIANNSGINFSAPKTVYFVGTVSANFYTAAWATSSGGTTNAANFPLPQDIAIIDNNSLNSGATLSIYEAMCTPTTSFASRTLPITFAGNGGGAPTFFFNGSLTLTSQVTMGSFIGGIAFIGRGSNTITSAGVSILRSITIDTVVGTVQLQDALNIGTNVITLTSGTFDANIYNVTAGSFSSNNSNTRTVAIGSGTWSLSGTSTTWNTGTTTGLTVTGTGTISMTAATAKTFAGGGASYSGITLDQGGAGALTISGSNTFKNITNTYSSTGATTILFTANVTQTVSQFTASGSAGKLLTLLTTLGTVQATIALTGGGTVSTNYLSVKDIVFTPGPSAFGTTPYVWYLGANSTNSGNNSGGVFTSGTQKVYQITNTATTSWTVPADWNSSSNTVYLIGGGGGGGGSRATSTTNKAGGAGGGGGGYTAVTNYSTTPSSSIAVAVGTGGTSGASSGGTGGTGGTTSWAVTNFATGGTGGSTTVAPTSVGGLGGTGTYSGGAGGAGSTTTTSGVIVTGGGGGGAAGPNGAGGAGGIGFANATATNTAGGGGGGNGGGTAGGNASSATGGTGGNNSLGTGGGAANTAGTNGGGGGGGSAAIGKSGGAGVDILNTIGGGGGAGGSGGSAFGGIAGSIYGAGGSGGTTSVTTLTASGGAGSQGLIVIAYTPSAVVTSTGKFFLMFQ